MMDVVFFYFRVTQGMNFLSFFCSNVLYYQLLYAQKKNHEVSLIKNRYILYEFLTETGHPAGDTFKIHLNNKSSSVMIGSRLEIHQKDLFG